VKHPLLFGALFGMLSALFAQDPPRPRPFPGGTQPPPQTQTQPPPAQGSAAHGLPLYPGADLLGKYQPGPNQDMYLYGSSAAFATVVEYYKTALKDGGRKLFGGPMHQFDIGRYRRETMTLQPAVTVKDFTWNGREGYVHVSGRQIVKYPTIIQVVPAPPER
jgi:hypothetical protein